MEKTACHLHNGAAGLFLSVLSAITLSVSALLVGSFQEISVLVFLAFQHVVIFVFAVPAWLWIARQQDFEREYPERTDQLNVNNCTRNDTVVDSNASKLFYFEENHQETRNSQRNDSEESNSDILTFMCEGEKADMKNSQEVKSKKKQQDDKQNHHGDIIKGERRLQREISQVGVTNGISERKYETTIAHFENEKSMKEVTKKLNESKVENNDRKKLNSDTESQKQNSLNDKEIIPKTGLKSIKDCVFVVIRGSMAYLTAWCAFNAFRYLPIGDASVLEYTNPIYSVILARVILKEPCGLVEAFLTLVMLTGIVLISRPSFLWGDSAALNPIGVTLAIATAVTSSINMLFGRKLKHVHSLIVIASIGLFSGIISWIVVLSTGGVSFPVTWLDWCAVVLNGVMAFTARISSQMALQIENVAIVSIVRTCEPIFVFTWQVTILHVIPKWTSVVGSLLILACVIALSIRKCSGDQGNTNFDGNQDALSVNGVSTPSEKHKVVLNTGQEVGEGGRQVPPPA
ncbi:uncharacterized protein LOC106165293 [Lingula anatina]|uniref:Uncharacterized protein LOC106165293 n=1 Tax=Lingula anatina TaxID=7574 RepID=A0A1S3ILY9_LINAN|nr:uncharacterized protein LOC106165293 [Lingula anatina]|eukprot:XP_013398911.1 uncharacterized protein LOC106165293 [Lingula anatina]